MGISLLGVINACVSGFIQGLPLTVNRALDKTKMCYMMSYIFWLFSGLKMRGLEK